MSRGIQDESKFIRAVLALEIENPENQPYTVGAAAVVIAYLRTVACEILEDEWVARYGIDVPERWITPQGMFGERDAAGNHTKAHKDAEKYARKFIRRDLRRSDCPFKLVIQHDADSGDDDVIIMKPAMER